MNRIEETPWISRFCGSQGNIFFCEVELNYILNAFNLTGLKDQVPYYREALEVILDMEHDEEVNNYALMLASNMLYGLIHARYILTKKGMDQMFKKFKAGDFGLCPRLDCASQSFLPIGLSDIPGQCRVKQFCPRCMHVYTPRPLLYIDGAYFGKGFPHMLLMVHPEHKSQQLTNQLVPRERQSWISWYCGLRENRIFCEVDRDYILDNSNLTGLAEKVPFYQQALNGILDLSPNDRVDDDSNYSHLIQEALEMLYGLIHARYILTNRGMDQMIQKYHAGSFGFCPRLFCEPQALLPIGISDIPGRYRVKEFCPKCTYVYTSKSSESKDGAYFGTTYPYTLIRQHPELRPVSPPNQYLPRLFGFKIHPLAYMIQRNKVLRS